MSKVFNTLKEEKTPEIIKKTGSLQKYLIYFYSNYGDKSQLDKRAWVNQEKRNT